MSARIRLLLLSFLMLFTELALIRWTGANVLYLSYFSNFVLLGSFLGIGVGFLWSKHEFGLFRFAPLALLGLVAFIRFFPVEVSRSGAGEIFFGGLSSSGPPQWVVLTIIFVVVSIAMACIGDGVARTFSTFEPLTAYRLDLVGSLLGIIVFTALSFLRAPSLGWGLIVGVAFVATEPFGLRTNRARLLVASQALALLGIIVILAFESFAPGTSWSPYYKIEQSTNAQGDITTINVNSVPHQLMFRVDKSANVFYNVPYQHLAKPRLDNVLIVGAGSGNDVAVALLHGARHVDAVEIDPRILDIGKTHHPNRPYQDKRVSVHINDGRAFLSNTNKKYDLIEFALPDSITLVTGQSSLRLESYLFTKESMESVRQHLAPHGVFAMYNYYRAKWLVDRYANTLRQVYGTSPCVTLYGNKQELATLLASRHPADVACTSRWKATASAPAPATDDRPFPYLRSPSIPSFYLETIALILLASILAVGFAVRGTSKPGEASFRSVTRYIDLFFMGAAFLLLETKNLVQFALLFGTTWLVNALVFGGILLVVLAAVEVTRRVRIPHPQWLYLVLLAALVVAWFVPPSNLLPLDPVLRFVCATLIAFAPIFIANLIFAERFKGTASSTTAFGVNLLGAMVGGVLEFAALVVGYRALLVLVGVLYGLALLTGWRYLGVPEDSVSVGEEPVLDTVKTDEGLGVLQP
ncbi:MAG TPA: spermidine synthase [Acidimicrobiia bacterium]|jgi:hypothetical protein